MTQHIEIGNSVQPLTNVAKMATLVKALQGRTHGLPGLVAPGAEVMQIPVKKPLGARDPGIHPEPPALYPC